MPLPPSLLSRLPRLRLGESPLGASWTKLQSSLRYSLRSSLRRYAKAIHIAGLEEILPFVETPLDRANLEEKIRLLRKELG